MADPVKISDLPAISSVQPNDIVPIVDSALTQTSRCTASQIASIGGGPPGDGTVTEGKLANGAVTYPKIQSVTGDRVLGRTSGASGVVQEIPCTSFARTLLAAADGNAARNLINDTPTFTGTVTVNGNTNVNGNLSVSGAITGQIRTPDGTASAPAYSFSDDADTGIARLGGPGTLSFVSNAGEKLRLNPSGELLSVLTNGTTLYLHFACRAWANVNGYNSVVRGSGNISSLTRISTGLYQFNFGPTPMPDGNYSVQAQIGYSGGNNLARGCNIDSATMTASYFRIRSGFFDTISWNTPEDQTVVTVAVFR